MNSGDEADACLCSAGTVRCVRSTSWPPRSWISGLCQRFSSSTSRGSPTPSSPERNWTSSWSFPSGTSCFHDQAQKQIGSCRWRSSVAGWPPPFPSTLRVKLMCCCRCRDLDFSGCLLRKNVSSGEPPSRYDLIAVSNHYGGLRDGHCKNLGFILHGFHPELLLCASFDCSSVFLQTPATPGTRITVSGITSMTARWPTPARSRSWSVSCFCSSRFWNVGFIRSHDEILQSADDHFVSFP